MVVVFSTSWGFLYHGGFVYFVFYCYVGQPHNYVPFIQFYICVLLS
jgi:hypothetical protein